MIVSTAITTVVLEFVHSVIKFSDVFQFTIFRGVPPGILFCAANLAEINFHRTSGIVVYHQIIISTCSDSAVITFSILSCDDRLIGYAFKERESQHQVFQILHLIVARIIQRIIPRLLCTISTTYTRFDKLHDGIMTVSMSERTCKYRPISITTYVIILPQQFVFIVQTMRYFFIDRFTVNHRLHGFHGQAAFYKTPVILFRIFFDRVVTISETLSIATMSALKHVEIQPGSVIEPSCGSCSSTWMECHQVIFVDSFDRGCQSFPFSSFHVATDISTNKPDNIRFVLITLCQKLAVCFCLFYSHLAPVHRASPNADHADILSLLCCCTDDVIHVIPITVYAFLIDVFEVVSVNHRILSVDIHRRNIVQRLNLNHVVSATFALFQVIFGFIPVQAFGQ